METVLTDSLGVLLAFVCLCLGLWVLAQGVAGAWRERSTSFKFRQPPRRTGRGGVERVTALSDLPLAQRVLSPVLFDLVRLFDGRTDHDRVVDNLRRSGWLYESPEDYYASTLVLAVVAFACAVLGGVALGAGPEILLIGLAGGGLALVYPNHRVRRALGERREAIQIEMAWVLDRLAAIMSAGYNLQPALTRLVGDQYAWLSSGSAGVFTALMRDVSIGLASGRTDYDDFIAEVRATAPRDLPELDEFLQIVLGHLRQGTSATAPLRLLARQLREKRNLTIDVIAQKTELQVSAVGSGVMLISLLGIVIGPALIGLSQLLLGGW